jgi:hypothetical protein
MRERGEGVGRGVVVVVRNYIMHMQYLNMLTTS